MKNISIRTDLPAEFPYGFERDSCAVYLSARKHGMSTFGTLKRALDSLVRMGHRTGFVNGEGDGAGVQTDIPRELWAAKLSQAGLRSSLVTHPGFWVGHIFIPHDRNYASISDDVNTRFREAGLNLLIEILPEVRPEVLGRSALQNPPSFVQIAGYSEEENIENKLLKIQQEIETDYDIHFASLSTSTVVYKVRGSVEALSRYYPDLKDRNFNTSIVLCHARYSTNTVSTFERAQPFAILGHNGEINTINRFCQEAQQVDIVLPYSGSDSQNVDRLLQSLCVQYGLDLFEAMEMIFPPTPEAVNKMRPELQAVYTRLRQAFGPYAQGPAGILARYKDTAIASVDALGLRPLWYFETEKEHIFSSERGSIFFENMLNDARPLAPGEKVGLKINRGNRIEVLNHDQIQEHVIQTAFQREAPQLARQYWSGWKANAIYENMPVETNSISQMTDSQNPEQKNPPSKCKPEWGDLKSIRSIDLNVLAAAGWHQSQFSDIQQLAKTGKDIVISLGFDGPLAAMDPNRNNIADYFKEKVAVVTNPAIDRGREIEAFSTETLVGARPLIGEPPNAADTLVTLQIPILLGGHPALGGPQVCEKAAQRVGGSTIEKILQSFEGRITCLCLGLFHNEDTRSGLNRLRNEAIQAVKSGTQCLVLDDHAALQQGLGWLDPHLATSAIDTALREMPDSPNLRRKTGLIVRSASIRCLHDIALLSSFGADAFNPYAMFAVCIGATENQPIEDEEELIERQYRLAKLLNLGLEKVISTMGCHELRGYGRVCSSIGLSLEVAQCLNSPNYFGSDKIGLSWEDLDKESALRGSELMQASADVKLPKDAHFFATYWKKVSDFTKNKIPYSDVQKTFQQLSNTRPVALRHLLGFQETAIPTAKQKVDLKINEYAMPLVIGAMSFGSQSELAFRAYAHAASILNIICINGEGGELPGILGLYKKNRGQQIASGRFGANAQFINSASIIEIKIGQGAKPGEGGMLPGHKITPQVAEARHTTPYVPLLSPSNNHDLYSIEDLAQLIEEIKLVNPEAKISVKIPVVPDIGVIVVGVAKAGADIINISGYDGGTGAARKHAIQYVGLPVEIGILQAHRALIDAGIRYKVELWCDGGMKSGADAVKMILLGANRVGFVTMAMIAIGCTVCRQCNKGICTSGIATQIRTMEEAKAAGLNNFVPLDYLRAVDQLVRLMTAIGEEMCEISAGLGYSRLQDLVGRADLLTQISFQEKIDLSSMFASVPLKPRIEMEPGVGRLLVRPRNSLTRLMSELVLNTVSDDEKEITYQDEVMAFDRALGAHLSGELARNPALSNQIDTLHLRFGPSSIAGNGFGAWIGEKIDLLIEGGAQDGVGKGASGGYVAVMKGLNIDGKRIDGSVGKSFAYGAIKGILIVQGNADSRACIRLSGASVVLGGEITQPILPNSNVGTYANLKGYACEYMTAGQVVILGDPGPYAFSGMTGGIVYQKLTPEMGFDLKVLKQRLARGSNVAIETLQPNDRLNIRSLLSCYIQSLEQTHQQDIAKHIHEFCEDEFMMRYFVKITPILSEQPLIEETP